mmetsp:Transcript_51320/g.116366  ORF Transcript_51320/g.116366 Transcript_51320/m.116366 type:complete len:214 (-) Transcript_51320:134-775(-)
MQQMASRPDSTAEPSCAASSWAQHGSCLGPAWQHRLGSCLDPACQHQLGSCLGAAWQNRLDSCLGAALHYWQQHQATAASTRSEPFRNLQPYSASSSSHIQHCPCYCYYRQRCPSCLPGHHNPLRRCPSFQPAHRRLPQRCPSHRRLLQRCPSHRHLQQHPSPPRQSSRPASATLTPASAVQSPSTASSSPYQAHSAWRSPTASNSPTSWQLS